MVWVSSAIILALRDLADGSFEMAAMRDVCTQFGQFVSADTGMTTFLVPDDFYLNLCVSDDEGLTVGAVIMTIAAWDTLWPREDTHDRVAYDAAYDRLLRGLLR